MRLGELLVVKRVDIFQITIQSKEELCGLWSGDAPGSMRSSFLRGYHTCYINFLSSLRRLSRRFNQSLQALVIDVGRGPLWDLVSGETDVVLGLQDR